MTIHLTTTSTSSQVVVIINSKPIRTHRCKSLPLVWLGSLLEISKWVTMSHVNFKAQVWAIECNFKDRLGKLNMHESACGDYLPNLQLKWALPWILYYAIRILIWSPNFWQHSSIDLVPKIAKHSKHDWVLLEVLMKLQVVKIQSSPRTFDFAVPISFMLTKKQRGDKVKRQF